jgi:hypothetical protein
MNKPDSAPRWFSGRRATDHPAQDDPADLGTAFGLDLSLNELQHEPPAVQPLWRKPGWVQRLAARRRPAA